jgi:diguanylate cyclase (GGDEF)-like protein
LVLLDMAGWLLLAGSVFLAGSGALRPASDAPALLPAAAAAGLLAASLLAASLASRRTTRPRVSGSAAITGMVLAAVQLTGGVGGLLFPAYFLLLLWMGLPRIRGPVLEAGLLLGLAEAASEVFQSGGGLGSLVERALPALRAMLGIPLFAVVCEVLLEKSSARTPNTREPSTVTEDPAGEGLASLLARCATAGSVGSAIHSAASWLVEEGPDVTATVALIEDESGALQVYESLGPLSQGRSGKAFPSSDSIAGWVSRSGGTVRRNRLRLGDRPVCTFSSSDESGRRAGSCAAAPLVCSGRIAGVLLLESLSDEGFGPGAESSVTLAASLLGLTLEKLLLQEQRQMLHCRDGLTGLPVLTDVMEYLLHATRDVQRFGKSISVIVAGIDSLPEHNQSDGYRHGDSVIRACAERLRDLAGGDAMLARIGGDRFAVCIMGADRARAEAVGDCILRSFADRPVHVDGRDEKVVVSVGACTTRAERRVQQLLSEACRALTASRQAGAPSLKVSELSAVPRQGGLQ